MAQGRGGRKGGQLYVFYKGRDLAGFGRRGPSLDLLLYQAVVH